MATLRPDHPFNTCSPEIALRAKEICAARGHKDIEAEIVCSDGVTTGIRVPVWQFYIAEARLIAAAPDLLAACEAAEVWLSGWASAEPYISTIRAAIAKAKVGV